MALPKARDGYIGLCCYCGKRTDKQFRLHQPAPKGVKATPPLAGMAGTPLPACDYKHMAAWGHAQGVRRLRVRRAY